MKENYTNDNPLLVRMNTKLKKQLLRYANSNDLSMAQVARKAINQYINEEKNQKGR